MYENCYFCTKILSIDIIYDVVLNGSNESKKCGQFFPLSVCYRIKNSIEILFPERILKLML